MKSKNRECVCVRKLLDAFADSELPAGERSRVATHLGRCAVCAEELRSIRALLGMLAAMPNIVPVSDLLPKIEQVVGCPGMHSTAASAGALPAVRRWDLSNVLWMPSLKYAAYASAAAVFMLGFWISWEASDRFMTLFRTARTKSVLVPADCYVARSTVMRNVETISEFHDGEGSSSLTEAMGLRTDEDGLYAVEM